MGEVIPMAVSPAPIFETKAARSVGLAAIIADVVFGSIRISGGQSGQDPPNPIEAFFKLVC